MIITTESKWNKNRRTIQVKTPKTAELFFYFYISGLGRFYSIGKDNEQHDEDYDRHYAELLQAYGDADDWARAQQSRQYFEAKVN